MGEQTYVEMNPTPAMPAAKKPLAVDLGIDLPLVLVSLTLVIFGLLMVYSASWDASILKTDDSSPTYYFNLQLLWLAIGLVSAAITTWLDYHKWQFFSLPMMGITVFLLIGLLLVGESDLGSVRAMYGESIRPAELAKLVIILYLSVWLIARRDQLNTWNLGLAPLTAILGLVGGLIMLQPDLSAALTVVMLGGLLFFLAGSNLRQILVLLIGVLIIGGSLAWLVSDTGRTRITDYLSGLRNIQESSDHVRYSLAAFVKGGLVGVGVGKSNVKHVGLPIPHTDSIFAVVGEETGILGAAGLVCLYLLFLWRSLVISQRAPDMLGKLIAAGIGFWITIEAMFNMAAMLGLVPFLGNVLPFMSYGGSNLIITLTGIGILLNIGRLSNQKDKERTQPFHAVVDLRGRHGRRRIPRFVYPANPEA